MIAVYSKNISSRLQYVLKIIFTDVLMIDYSIIVDSEIFQSIHDKKINYSDELFADAITIKPCGLLEENKITQKFIKSGQWNNIPVIFANDENKIPFDLFSAVFYMVSRYEEYLPFVPDKHGRYEARQSISVNKNFLHLPVVELWCKQLAVELGIYDLCKGIQPSNYHFQLTIDIDRAWKYKNSGILRNTAILIRDLLKFKYSLFKRRVHVLLNLHSDPYDNFEYLNNIQTQLKEKIIYFILCSKPARYDDNLSTDNKLFRQLINKLFNRAIIGIHPSYQSNESFEILKSEHSTLEEIIKQKVFHSRQHFLKLIFPGTYWRLIKLGILHDYTMGYSDKCGFRAGIARPYFFYDLSAEKQTDLRIIPFQIMDRTLLSYLKLKPEEAIRELEYYKEIISGVGGHFVTLWHNSSLSDEGEWEGWKNVFEKMIYINK
jgi:hypothetical protein